MRLAHLTVLCFCIASCHRQTDVRGIYAYQNGFGTLFPCDDPNTIVYVPDSALAAQYRRVVASNRLAYVRLRGINTRSGSIYSGRPFFVVQEILEIRAKVNEDCPKITQRISSMLVP